jgi:chromosome segregation ATPase
MLTTKNLEKLIELEQSLRTEYQVQLDAKSAEIESCIEDKEKQQAAIDRQLEQIGILSKESSANKRVEQLNRELHQRCENLQQEITTQKKRLKGLQNDLAEVRAEVKVLKQFDPARMKKNLDANKRKLAEKTAANDLLQKLLNQAKTEKSEAQRKVEELEAKLALLEDTEAVADTEAVVDTEAVADTETVEEAAA